VELDLRLIAGETKDIIDRANAVSPTLATALTTFGDTTMVEQISTALAPVAMMNGVSAIDILSQLFKGTALEGTLTQLGARARLRVGEPK
jgi:hypothetical protein